MPASSATTMDASSQYYHLAREATDWITSFQVTPLTATWGIPYPGENAWGLDPYYYSNGTITAGTNGIKGGARQQLAYLLGGHDAGLGASAALDFFLNTQDPRYLTIFNTYYAYFQRSQLPSSTIPATRVVRVHGQNVTVDDSGFFAEQASVSSGPDGIYGTPDDHSKLETVYSAAEHGNPIATALISYYRLTHDAAALGMLNRYGNWLVRVQIRAGNFSGAFPVSQYYAALGWKPRMYETAESAWILCELYLITGNRTYLDSAVAAGRYMVSRQFPTTADPHVIGALPYEWNETRYTSIALTNFAGFALLAWTQLYRVTGNQTFLEAAKRYATWLLSFQVTPFGTPWGDHAYGNDSMAVGGFYYGYNTARHEFGWRVALSLWSAADSIPGLLLLSRIADNGTYESSARLAAQWLTLMRYPDQSLIPLQSLAIIKYVMSSWWGLYPQFYQPDMNEVRKAGIPQFVATVQANPSILLNRNESWFEATFNVNFNAIDYQMAARGDRYMKMIWSWWPDLGFEPRYGGDIAYGEYSAANYFSYGGILAATQTKIAEIEQLTNNQTSTLPANVTDSYATARSLLNEATSNFSDGWCALAVAELGNSTRLLDDVLGELAILAPVGGLRTTVTVETIALFALVFLIVCLNAFWRRRLRSVCRNQTRKGAKRKRVHHH